MAQSKRTQEEWRAIVEGHDPQRQSAIEYCKEKGITVNTFYYWRDRIRGYGAKIGRPTGERPGVRGKQVTNGTYTHKSGGMIQLNGSSPSSMTIEGKAGVKVSIPMGTSADEIRKIVEALA